MTLEELLEKELPLNRKERFFTGTVFPMIVCRDNFKHFDLFASLLRLEGLEIKANPDYCNIQFFTEYNLRESIYDTETRSRFGKRPERNDTPDILILITGETKTLISIEAKMYDAPESYELEQQLINQEKYVLDFLREKLGIHSNFIHKYALLPKSLADELHDFAYPVITWDDILKEYGRIYTDDYFLDLLRIALDRYGKLRAERRGHSQNCERYMSGKDIYKEHTYSTPKMKVMGRQGGLKAMRSDVDSGRWQKQMYETNSQDTLFTLNWFRISEFISEIEKHLNGEHEHK